jgi:hypothetical protein
VVVEAEVQQQAVLVETAVVVVANQVVLEIWLREQPTPEVVVEVVGLSMEPTEAPALSSLPILPSIQI